MAESSNAPVTIEFSWRVDGVSTAKYLRERIVMELNDSVIEWCSRYPYRAIAITKARTLPRVVLTRPQMLTVWMLTWQHRREWSTFYTVRTTGTDVDSRCTHTHMYE